MWIDTIDLPDTTEASALTSQLVAIDSINPSLVEGGAGEREIAGFVAKWLAGRGLDVEIQDTVLAGRPNVIAMARGHGGGPSLRRI